MSKISFDELRRIIREEEPPTPSTRLSTLDAASETALETVSQNRLSDPRTLSRQIRGELDWIVMKALEKDRTRRYESASELAKDVQRYLDDEPVEACPPSTVYLLKKTIRRHKVGLTFAATVALAMILGLIGTTWQAVRATEAEAAEREQAQLTDEQRQAAEANYVRAREAVKQMLTRVADNELAAIPEMGEVRKQLMADARLFYDELIKLNPGDAQAYFERAEVRDALHDPIVEVIADYEKAIELAPLNADYEQRLSHFLRYRGKDKRRALKHAQRAVALSPDNLPYLAALADLHVAFGQHENALALHEKAVAIAPTSSKTYTARSNTLRLIGRKKDALVDARKAVELDPTSKDAWMKLSYVLVDLKNYDEALVAVNRAIDIVGQTRKTDYFFVQRCSIHEHLGNDTDALRDISRAIELNPTSDWAHRIRAHLYQEQGRNAEAEADLSKATELAPNKPINWTALTDLLLAMEEWDEAFVVMGRAIDIVGHSQDGASLYLKRAQINKDHGNLEEALEDYTAYIELSATPSWHILKRRGWLYFELGRYDEALADIAKAIELNPGDLSNLRWIAPSRLAACTNERFRTGLLELADRTIELTDKAARAYAGRGQVLAAFGHEEQALADLKTAFDTIPTTTERSELNRSATCEELGYLCGELAHRQDVIPYLAKLVELVPEDVVSTYRCALAQLGAGQTESYRKTCLAMLSQFQDTKTPANGYWTAWTCLLGPKAVDDYVPVVRLAEQAVEATPKSVAYLNTLGAIFYRAGRAEEAVERMTEANELIEDPTTSSPAYGWYFLAMAHHKLGNDEEAQKWLDKANQWSDKVLDADEPGAGAVPWNRKLTLKLLREEAEELMGTNAATEETQPTEEPVPPAKEPMDAP
jgi:tetratricopeptide (TPR) repeat protein